MDLPNVGGSAGLPSKVDIYDTTLRDGAQLEGISLTVDDKLRIARTLDELGVHFIEGGWPGANPKDNEFFERAKSELTLKNSTLVAFGSTRRVGAPAQGDETLENLLAAETDAVCIVGKASHYHVTEALRTTPEEGIAMVADSVAYLVSAGKSVFLDAEHFFDGYRDNPEFSLAVLGAAATAGASAVVLCDTNGGTLPFDVERITTEAVSYLDGVSTVGIHCHNDTGCAVANSLAAVRGGALQVQGTINGYGERVGNANLVTIAADLTLKMGIETLGDDRLANLTSISHHIAEIVNMTPDHQAPYVGASAFAHKAGLHTSAIARRSDAYEHINPVSVGNGTRFLVSEMAGRSTIEMRAHEIGLELSREQLTNVVETLKRNEHTGYHYEAADASLQLVLLGASGWTQPFFAVESFKVVDEQRVLEYRSIVTQTKSTVSVTVGDEKLVAQGEGNGPVAALDTALRSALADNYPALERIQLVDYKVRVVESSVGTSATTRVLIDTSDGDRTWTTIGVSANIIEASWIAMRDAVIYGLLRASGKFSSGSSVL